MIDNIEIQKQLEEYFKDKLVFNYPSYKEVMELKNVFIKYLSADSVQTATIIYSKLISDERDENVIKKFVNFFSKSTYKDFSITSEWFKIKDEEEDKTIIEFHNDLLTLISFASIKIASKKA
jgi:hypothetical protein